MTNPGTRPSATAPGRPGGPDPARGEGGIDFGGLAVCVLGLAFAVLLVFGSCTGFGAS